MGGVAAGSAEHAGWCFPQSRGRVAVSLFLVLCATRRNLHAAWLCLLWPQAGQRLAPRGRHLGMGQRGGQALPGWHAADALLGLTCRADRGKWIVRAAAAGLMCTACRLLASLPAQQPPEGQGKDTLCQAAVLGLKPVVRVLLQVKSPSRGGVDPHIAARSTRATNGSLVLGQSQDCYGGHGTCCDPASRKISPPPCPCSCMPSQAAPLPAHTHCARHILTSQGPCALLPLRRRLLQPGKLAAWRTRQPARVEPCAERVGV